MSGIVYAALWMSGALVSFLCMAVSGRELSAELNTFQILFYRSIIGVMVIAVILSATGWRQIRTERLGLHAIRNTIHFGAQFGWFYAISIISLAQVFALEFTVPIWTAIIAPFLLGERLTATRALAVGIGFAGILVILRPGMVPFDIGTASAFGAAIGFALAHMLTKKITRTDAPIAVIFYMTLMQLPMGAVPSLIEWATPSLAMVPWLLLVGITALSAHYCMARAFAHADAIVVVPMDFLRLPLVAVLGLFLYGEQLDPWVLGGACIILAGILVNILTERRQPRS